MVKGICLRYARNEDDAEDMMQDTFIKVFRTLDQFKGKGDVGAWIRRIAVNTAIEKWRKKQREKQIFDKQDMEYLAEIHPEPTFDHLAMDALLQLIQSLPIGFRTIFNLYAIEGYKHKEIAEKLNIKEGTSKSQYARARALLQRMINENESYMPTSDPSKTNINPISHG